MIKLRPYQQQIAQAIIDSIQVSKGLTFSVEIARQGGKNELSAILETILLTLYINYGGNIVKASPTFKPQTMISMERLKQRLDDYSYSGIWRSESGYIISLGSARAIFLSADGTSNVVGHTADILLEIDESQDVSQDKYTKEFRPMASAYNTTTVHYGTTWDDSTLLEEIKQTNLELERKDGIKRHFRFDWQEVAKYNPEYGNFVQQERERLGENHPLFLTQYALLPIHGGGYLLTHQQRAQLLGSHQRLHHREDGKFYIAGIDLAGEATFLEPTFFGKKVGKETLNFSKKVGEETSNFSKKVGEETSKTLNLHDATVITIAEVDTSARSATLWGQHPCRDLSGWR